MLDLNNIYQNYINYCDKGDRKSIGKYGHYYIEKYDYHFSKIRTTAKNVLEVGTMSGASALMWSDYFENANIYTLDRDLPTDNSRWPDFFPPVNMEYVNRIKKSTKIQFIQGDAYDKNMINLLKNIKFDIVIDDGFHSLKTMKFFIKNYFKLLNTNGIGAIEDIGLDGLATIEKLEKIIKRSRLRGQIFKYDFDNDVNYEITRAKNTKPHDKLIIFEKS
jgi:hypothetical protein